MTRADGRQSMWTKQCLTLALLLSLGLSAFEAVSAKGKTSRQATAKITDGQFTYAFTGDIMFGRFYGRHLSRHDRGSDGRPKEPYPLTLMRPLLENSAYTLVNLENPIITDVPKDLKWLTRRFTIRLAGEPKDVMTLKNLGVDFVSLANNHVYDANEEGLEETIKHLDAAGLEYAGATLGTDPYQPIRSKKTPVETYVFSGATFVNRVQYFTKSKVAIARTHRLVSRFIKMIKRLRQKKPAALIIVGLHWGPENKISLRPDQTINARRLVDAGADIVVGHHPHVLHPVEVYRGGVIFYSLGNFFFDQVHELQRHGMVAQVKWHMDGQLKRPKLASIQLHGILRPRDLGAIQRATKRNRVRILGRVKHQSETRHKTKFSWVSTSGVLEWAAGHIN